MKNLILVLAAVIALTANVVHAELTPTPVFATSMPGGCPEIAMDVDEEGLSELLPAVVYESGNDIEVVIFGEKFVIEKQFTIHDYKKYCPDADKYTGITKMWVESTDMQSVCVSRNFFVNNNKWCVLVNFRDYYDSSKSDSKVYVIDEDSNLIGVLTGNGYGEIGEIFLDGFRWGHPYLLVSKGNEGTFQLYTFSSSNGIEPVKVASFAKGYPNPLPAGRTFNIDLSQPADNATYVSVVDMNGRQVLRRRVPYGESSYSISGHRFGHGNYIYTVVYGDGESVTGKLIAE